jgi:hypothetical protein
LHYLVESPVQVFPGPSGLILVESQIKIPVQDMLQEFRQLPVATIGISDKLKDQDSQDQGYYDIGKSKG